MWALLIYMPMFILLCEIELLFIRLVKANALLSQMPSRAIGLCWASGRSLVEPYTFVSGSTVISLISSISSTSLLIKLYLSKALYITLMLY